LPSLREIADDFLEGMSHMMQSVPRFAGVPLTLALLLAASVGRAGELPAVKAADTGDKAKVEHLIYNVQRGSANDIAKILANQFKGTAVIDAAPESFGNCLLIRGSSGEIAEVLKLLAAIDRKPQMIAIEIFFVEVPPAKEDAAKNEASKADKPVKELELQDFCGPAPAVVANLQALTKQGRITSLRRARLTMKENSQSTLALTEDKPMLMGVTTRSGGAASRSFKIQQVGAEAKVTARVQADKRIDLDIDSTSSRLETDPTAILGKDEKGDPLFISTVVKSRFNSKLSLTSGNAVAVDAAVKNAKGEGFRDLVIVTAKLTDPNAAPEKEEIPANNSRVPAGRRRPERPQPVQPQPGDTRE
jgi:type II secretory pathway component GspD/PulD (secretin)